MQTFRQFILSEKRLPYTHTLLDFLKKSNIIQKIQKVGNKKNPTEIEHVDAISHFNPYSKKEEVIDIYLNFKYNDTLGLCAKPKKNSTRGKDYWIIVLYWNNIKDAQKELDVSLENLILGRIYHEINHAIDPTIKPSTYDEEQISTNPTHRHAYLLDPREVNSRTSETVNTIKDALQKNRIDLKMIQYYLTKSNQRFVFWLALFNPAIKNALWFYMKEKPEIIQNIRQILYNEIFNPQDRNLPTPRKVRSTLWV